MNKAKFFDETILIVDDEEEICEILKSHFEFLGAEVFTATNSKDALKILTGHYVDVIISDINMAEINGFEFLEIVKNRKMHRKPFFLMSGRDDLSVASLEKLGAKAFFSKPLAFDDIELKVAKALGLTDPS